MKVCSKCKVSKDLGEFGVLSKAKDGLQYYCKPCKADNHQENRESRIESIRKAQDIRREVLQKGIIDYLRLNPCIDCGNSDIRVLDFDHVRGVKLYDVTYLVRSVYPEKTVWDEVAKCDVRCKNCHAIVTYERLGGSWRDKFLVDIIE